VIIFPHNGILAEFYAHIARKVDDKAAQNQDAFFCGNPARQ
jgi:hypothetical protein